MILGLLCASLVRAVPSFLPSFRNDRFDFEIEFMEGRGMNVMVIRSKENISTR